MSLRLRNLQSIEYLTSQTMRRAASHWLNFGRENPDKPRPIMQLCLLSSLIFVGVFSVTLSPILFSLLRP